MSTDVPQTTTYYVWPDDTKQSVEDEGAFPYAWKSDDFLTVALTQEQADIMTYDEMVQAMQKGVKHDRA